MVKYRAPTNAQDYSSDFESHASMLPIHQSFIYIWSKKRNLIDVLILSMSRKTYQSNKQKAYANDLFQTKMNRQIFMKIKYPNISQIYVSLNVKLV